MLITILRTLLGRNNKLITDDSDYDKDTHFDLHFTRLNFSLGLTIYNKTNREYKYILSDPGLRRLQKLVRPSLPDSLVARDGQDHLEIRVNLDHPDHPTHTYTRCITRKHL